MLLHMSNSFSSLTKKYLDISYREHEIIQILFYSIHTSCQFIFLLWFVFRHDVWVYVSKYYNFGFVMITLWTSLHTCTCTCTHAKFVWITISIFPPRLIHIYNKINIPSNLILWSSIRMCVVKALLMWLAVSNIKNIFTISTPLNSLHSPFRGSLIFII